jgi:pSer/pThr/pTyr-binding forkhead associated (FHA) protein
MGKLVIKNQGRLIDEVDLKLGDTKIGRLPACDIVLDDPAVSGEHAVIKTVGLKSSIQDLDSTNGTFIENTRIRQHELKHGETILIGKHTLLYRSEVNLDAPVFGKKQTVPPPPTARQEETTVLVGFAQLLVMDGKSKGKRVPLIKETVTLENPGKNPARIHRTSEGYLLEAAAGPGEPTLNGRPVPHGGQLLEKGDVIEVAGVKLQFSN